MKIESINSFVATAPEIQDLLDAAYVVTCYATYTAIQANFSGELVKKYLEKASLHINPNSGFIEGTIDPIFTAGGLPIQITLTE